MERRQRFIISVFIVLLTTVILAPNFCQASRGGGRTGSGSGGSGGSGGAVGSGGSGGAVGSGGSGGQGGSGGSGGREGCEHNAVYAALTQNLQFLNFHSGKNEQAKRKLQDSFAKIS